MNRTVSLVFLFVAICASAEEQERDLFIRNGTLYTMTNGGAIENGNVLIRNGLIVAVGNQVQPSDSATVIDATSKAITPGLFNSITHLGLVEIERISDTVDFRTTKAGYSASFSVAPAVNPMSTLIPIVLSHGLFHVISVPSPGHSPFAGQGAAVRLVESGLEMVDESVAIFATYGSLSARYAGGSRAAAYQMMHRAFADTREYQRHRKSVLKGEWRQLSLGISDLEVLSSVLSGEKPLVVTVHRAADILSMLRLKREFVFRLVVAGASEAWMVADQLAAEEVPVILDPLQNIPITFDHLGARLDNPALLSHSGVTVLFAGVDYVKTHRAFFIRQAAGNAVAHGMSRIDAIKAITINPATVFGLDDKFGSIAAGKKADLVIWSGDPLELLTVPEHLIVDGRVVSATTRSSRLRERYRDLDSGESFLYRK